VIHYGWSTSHSLAGLGGADGGGGASGAGGGELAAAGPSGWRWSGTHTVLEQDLQAIDKSSCGVDRGGGDGGGGSEEEEYVEGRRGKSLRRSWRSLNRSRCRSPWRRRSNFGCPTLWGVR
jgi:hypothetical protein